ncbi:PLP-dependent aminotransferase family protein [Comamonadaceae bacterium OTU4NAUVB1]|nr:PLP-dependent aminotransferase family protein [Comamonadaceae bacterium OTU4NAUVB1]
MRRPPWMLAIDVMGGPRYKAIVEGVRAGLMNGSLKVGERLPPQREFARMLGLNLGTVTRAFDALCQAGLARGEVGRGTFLTLPSASIDSPPSLWEQSRPPGFIDLSHNFPERTPDLAGADLVLAELVPGPGVDRLLATQVDAGRADHRTAAARWLAGMGMAVSAQEVTITCGAQHGLLMALGALTRPGDMVLAEELTFYGIKSAAAMLGRNLVGVRMDHEGLRPEALDLAARRSGAKVLFCCPTLHNPSTATMGLERRHAILEVCRRHDLVVVEDDVYGFMLDDPLPPLASLAPERVVHVTGLSKLAGPGLRIGYVAAAGRFGQALGVALRATTLMASPLNAAVAQRLMNAGALPRIARAIRAETRARQALVDECFPPADRVSHPGSFYFGLRTGPRWTAPSFARAAEQAGIGVTPYDLFEVTPLTGDGMVRICHNAAPDRDGLRRALAGLKALRDG